ncbi:nuclear transport factor 2 family protein [Marivirga sp.]|uniref:nuclear transport factor 2 family protein n=1 Tax=Marivirga sp. TaxID=2018662 RepID=UPI002D7EDC53|nr:nuclear transport factor 2 family protein [Marivirga sp.]HET8858465.1 nuclear transport factor 2 family protein [Marivirga sp.]
MQKTNKNIARDFLELIGKGKIEEAFKNYLANDFKHHNPFFKGDSNSLKLAMNEDALNNPQKELNILRVLADGEFVVVHSQVKQNPSDYGFVFVHILKFKDRKIVELWDLGQEVPQ